ncbi:unnamed protein product [Darwinula stevensoni]|uniref:CARD domain-containing protein n=1 Tax=Darwinula stevensoni TaxID=69355 RepID=A0A7R8XAA4_9CRUS|nr:unnamed protein product [Darwinula stevensoni]CAG0889801.1 unnamed protein product [Darwinula stevensoni]
MNREGTDPIISRWNHLVDNLEADHVAPILISKGFLSPEWDDEVHHPKTRRKKSEAILITIRRKGPAGFQALKEALAAVHQLHLLE